ALVSIAQLDPPSPHHRWLMLSNRIFKNPGQLVGRPLGHSRLVTPMNRLIKIPYPSAMQRRDKVNRRIVDKVQATVNFPFDGILGILLHAIPLIDGNDYGEPCIHRKTK